MKLDLGSFAFGSTVVTGGNTPSWGTSLGQKKPALKFTYPGYDNILIGMMYKSIPTNKVFIPLGKGGRVYNSLEDEGIQLAALFDKVYINEIKVDAPFIMLIYCDSSDSWSGRRTLKYNVKIEYRKSPTEVICNSNFVVAARKALQLEDNACWVVSDIYIVNQDELHLVAGIVNQSDSIEYPTAELRKTAFLEAIKNTYDNNPHIKEKYSSESLSEIGKTNSTSNLSLQQIYYGAPGTGKSHTIDEIVNDKNSIRTTFHPDSDYASFVGCYKPVAKKDNANKIYTQEYLCEKLKELQKNETYPCQKFGAIYWKSLEDINAGDIKDVIRICEFPDSMYNEVTKGIAVGKELSKNLQDSEITYDFVPQAFTKAYIAAWKDTSKPYYLVIEEINRGNCAQIFGDLFQLLDRREDGFSSYEIAPDTDLQQYLAKEFMGVYIDDEKIKAGESMRLPSNLYILATMNTSDQSLFPIDSAFKRRWDWKYIPIKNEGKNHKIVVGEAIYDWWNFIKLVNDRIENVTDSEDKQIGYWFAKANDKNQISAETLVSKVLFYLWNDVFKDYTHNTNSLFKTDKRKYKFREFYLETGDVKTDLLNQFLLELGLKNETPQSEETQSAEE